MTDFEIDAVAKANIYAQYNYINMHLRDLHNTMYSEDWDGISEDLKGVLELKYKSLVMLNAALEEELSVYGASKWLT
ncbi:hypothetical protein [Pseudoalteromonas sp.]|uniref:hypothetical protein n=1 Tax=Pseudoalteromonas sp. TaxID=53249 RepID=UPI0035690E20